MGISLIGKILLARLLHLFAALYAATLASGTYIGQLFVLLNALILIRLGGVVASITI